MPAWSGVEGKKQVSSRFEGEKGKRRGVYTGPIVCDILIESKCFSVARMKMPCCDADGLLLELMAKACGQVSQYGEVIES